MIFYFTSYAKEACTELKLSDLTSILYICTRSEKYQYFTESWLLSQGKYICGYIKRQVIDPRLMKTILNCHLPYHQLLLPVTVWSYQNPVTSTPLSPGWLSTNPCRLNSLERNISVYFIGLKSSYTEYSLLWEPGVKLELKFLF